MDILDTAKAALKKEYDDIKNRIGKAAGSEKARLEAQFNARLEHLAARLEMGTPTPPDAPPPAA